ncbi:Acg family FMN-binding oxidoreductase [Mycobacterium sp. NPDC048908]|uniref:Acg family FMN-binding oxidoreductase n=1 Tax=Mycobacterium sp. NPDC048908 TaxID=3364292 RepID=UPI00370FCDDE
MAESVTSADAITAEQVTAILELACRAPSLHNSQPWRWAFNTGTLRLFADHSRVGVHTDSTGREVILSCGAVLDHLQVAAAAAGWVVSVERYPDPHNHDHLASAIFRRSDYIDDHVRTLAEAIAHRHTDRLAFAAPEPWEEMERQLRALLRGTATFLDVIDEDGRPILADASRRSEEHRRDDASYRYELLWWTGHSSSEGGVPSSALPSTVEASHVDIAREFPAYGSGDRRPQVERDHSKILVLSTYDDGRENTLHCGEALSRTLLECTAAGFATCTLTHMIELHESREIVRRLTGRRAEPQLLIRVGRVPDVSPSPVYTRRRPIADVLQLS